jgi:hypothetical protein
MGQRRLSRMQRLLRLTGFRDVDQRADDLVFADVEPHAVGADAKVLRRAIRHQPTKLVVVVLFALPHAVDLMLHDSLVILMHPLQKQVDRRLRRLVESQYSIAFLRPEGVAARNLPAETAGPAELLGFVQVGFDAPALGILGFQRPVDSRQLLDRRL